MRQVASNTRVRKVIHLLVNVVQYRTLEKKGLDVRVCSPVTLAKYGEEVIPQSELLAKTFIGTERLAIQPLSDIDQDGRHHLTLLFRDLQ